ncbi:MAG: biosynthetic-type acetolactate synthase large subunit [Intestinimonas sp.]|nr:biosynthetic-type acetolactate synthase large subunit [Intestinimonas sp.]
MLSGAQVLMESLQREHVTHIFGYAGATICPAVDALAAADIGYTLVRTEQNAGHMASGYARITGKPGVCMVTSGPGATNLITGIATAYMDSIPMVAITGQVQSYLLGRDIFQEVDITGAVAPFTKHSYLVKDAGNIPQIVKEAFLIASTGRQGPVLIDLPIDIQKQMVEPHYPDSVEIRGYKPSVKGNELQVRRVIQAISAAHRPLLCAGGGLFSAGGQADLEELAVTAGIPVVTTMMGLGLLPTDHPMNMGMIGAFGTPLANVALDTTDLLIIAGARAADRAISAPREIARRTKTVHIDVDPAEIGKNMFPTVPVVGNVKVILNQLLARHPKADTTDWLAELQPRRRKELQNTPPHPRTVGVDPAALMRGLGGWLDENACVCVDVGQNQIWAARYLPLRRGRFLTSGGLGTMGYSLPAALGVKVAQPERQTVVVCGDGSFQMSMNELATLCAMGADVKIVILENGVLGLVNQIQHSSYSGPFGVALTGSPDFSAVAAAYGISCGTASSNDELDKALDQMFGSPGPYLLTCTVDPDASTND